MLRVLVLLSLFASTVHADDKVALLPLDSSAKLDVYGQVVASEIAKVLVAGKIDVVVVQGKMAVPAEAKLIVDGKIAQGKGGTIELSLRIREPAVPGRDPTKVDRGESFPATATSLETLEKTTKELADKVLVALHDRLAKKPVVDVVKPPVEPPVVVPQPRTMPARPLLVGIGAKPGDEALRAALGDLVSPWASAANRAVSVIEVSTLDSKTAAKTVAGSNADRAIAFDVKSYRQWKTDEVPMASARVRVRIADAGQVLFDRVVVTDTVVGSKAMPPERLAALVAEEVLSILRPHVRRTVTGWP